MSELTQALVDAGFADDEHWAETLIQQGLITLNDEVVNNKDIKIALNDKLSKIGFIVQCGKRKWVKCVLDKELRANL